MQIFKKELINPFFSVRYLYLDIFLTWNKIVPVFEAASEWIFSRSRAIWATQTRPGAYEKTREIPNQMRFVDKTVLPIENRNGNDYSTLLLFILRRIPKIYVTGT